ncbi:ATP-binding cassette, subfamily B [Ferrithrix thermotolerans DSM 19514]|uniref:ATP-binding cassette, subfamily B n=1 Tax=Ferrithrix thermotolerans DSM 19514 TaxID=1121881 RepID=A0A1M4YAC6_9ACTN|nr:ABC transporter ATP-binding protein [Ferrithrix thermotolerans]SHF02741.1 ATP-binding cassette, subfamily B [Ferrithrix thermotolerans DSM 19514]
MLTIVLNEECRVYKANRYLWAKRVLRTIKPQQRDTNHALAAAVLGTVATVLIPVYERSFIDSISRPHPGRYTGDLLALAVLALASFAFAYLRRISAARLSLGTQHRLRTKIFDHLQRLDFKTHDSLKSGQLVSQANADISLIQGLLAFLPRLFGNLLFALLSVAVMSVIYWPLALVEAVSLAVIATASSVLRSSIVPASEVAQEQKGRVNEIVEETVRGIGVIKGSGFEEVQMNKLKSAAHTLYNARVATIWRQAKLASLLQLLPVLTQAVVIGLGGYAAIEGKLSIGSFLLFSTYITFLDTPIRQLSSLVAVAQQAQAAIDRVFSLLEIEPEIREPEHPVTIPEGPLDVIFQDVEFSYNKDAPVLRRVTVTIRSGETVAVVGASGSGKTSLALLIPRFYDVQSGQISIAGIDIRLFSLKDLRSKVAVVFEDSFLFSTSIRENITFGVPDISEDDLIWAVKAAKADGFISQLPGGLDTVVGERGVKLSGGQRQRVALARALLKRPPILILDDATSSVDPQTEADIHEALTNYAQQHTLILIAHRRSTLTLADRIIVLDEGRVAAEGTYEELWETSREFRSLIATSNDRFVADNTATPTLSDRIQPKEHDDVVPPRLFQRRIDQTPTQGRFSFKKLFKSVRLGIAVGSLLVALDAALSLAGPLLLRRGIDSGITQRDLHLVIGTALLLAGVGVLDLFVVAMEQMVTGVAAERFLYYLKAHIFKKLLSLDMGYYESEMSGRIMTRMISDVDAFSSLVQIGLASSLVALFTFALIVIVMVALSISLSELLILALPFALIASLVFRRYSVRAYRSAREKIAIVNANFQEQLSGVRVSRSLGQSERVSKGFAESSTIYKEARMQAQRAVAIYFPFLGFLSDLTTVAVLGEGGSLVLAHKVAIGTLVAASLYVTAFFSPIQELSQNFDEYQQVVVATAQIRKLMNETSTVKEIANPIAHGELRGDIEFVDVRFSYDNSPPYSLDGVNLTIKSGQRVAFVGETGAGKSTIAKLIERFYDTTSGQIYIDGTPLGDLDLKWYRSQIAYLPQEPFLFSGTIADNVTFGLKDTTLDDVETACREVGLGRLLSSHKEGVFYEVGDKASKLSAGERQLVVFARLLLRNPRLVILDEVSSALDLTSEAQVQSALDKVAERRTVLIIAHRLSSLKNADQIFVIDSGSIVEQGTHDELIEMNGYYNSLWTLSRQE